MSRRESRGKKSFIYLAMNSDKDTLLSIYKDMDGLSDSGMAKKMSSKYKDLSSVISIVPSWIEEAVMNESWQASVESMHAMYNSTYRTTYRPFTSYAINGGYISGVDPIEPDELP